MHKYKLKKVNNNMDKYRSKQPRLETKYKTYN